MDVGEAICMHEVAYSVKHIEDTFILKSAFKAKCNI